MTALPIRLVAAARLLLALALLVRPGPIGRAVAGNDAGAPAAWLVRLLGGRLLIESAVELARPSAAVARCGAGVDATHAVSMVLVAVLPSHRRAALSSGAVAAAGAGLSLWASRFGRERRLSSAA